MPLYTCAYQTAVTYVLTDWGWDKMSTVSQTIFWDAFEMHLRTCKFLYFEQHFTEICPEDPIDNNLALI